MVNRFFFLLLVPADSGRTEAPCLVRYVYLFFRMVLLLRVLCRLRFPDVREDEEGVIAGHRHEKDKNDLSVLHGYMALDNGVLSSGKGRKDSPSLVALASSRAFRHVASVKYSMFLCTPVMYPLAFSRERILTLARCEITLRRVRGSSPKIALRRSRRTISRRTRDDIS